MDKQLKDILKEQMQVKGVSFERLREQTGIAERYLTGLLDNDAKKLPPVPYIRGYIIKIAAALNLDGNEIWESYKSELLQKSSGPNDRLPINRFALKKIGSGRIIAAALGIFVLVYLALSANRFLGQTNIEIVSPALQTTISTANTINLLGKVNSNAKLLIDNEEVITDAEGNFQKLYSLEPGLNIIEFSTKKVLGQVIKITKQVIYEPKEDVPVEEKGATNEAGEN
jgi:cytoskeletal protein RodZ